LEKDSVFIDWPDGNRVCANQTCFGHLSENDRLTIGDAVLRAAAMKRSAVDSFIVFKV
jgi:hypothetical protein